MGADAGSAAEFEMVVEAGAFVFAIDGTVAVEVGEYFADGFEGTPDSPAAGKGAEIAGAVFQNLSDAFDFGVVVLPVDLYIWVTFVIFEHHIVVRLVAFNQIVFEDQRFHFGRSDPPRDVPHFADHLVDAGRVFGGRLEVAAHAMAQDKGFTHIENASVLVPH